jgi:hypothetical protein
MQYSWRFGPPPTGVPMMIPANPSSFGENPAGGVVGYGVVAESNGVLGSAIHPVTPWPAPVALSVSCVVGLRRGAGHRGRRPGQGRPQDGIRRRELQRHHE